MSRHAPLFLLAVSSLACGGSGGADVPPEVAQAVRERIESRIHARNDSLRLPHPATGDTVALAFERIHESVRSTPGGRWAACVDFRDPEDTVWDLDYYVDDETGEMVVEHVVIHRVGDEDVLPETARRQLDQAR